MGEGYNPYRKENGEFATKTEAGAKCESDLNDAIESGDTELQAKIKEVIMTSFAETDLGQKILAEEHGAEAMKGKRKKNKNEFKDYPAGKVVTTKGFSAAGGMIVEKFRKMKNGSWRDEHGNVWKNPTGQVVSEDGKFALKQPPQEYFDSDGYAHSNGKKVKKWHEENRENIERKHEDKTRKTERKAEEDLKKAINSGDTSSQKEIEDIFTKDSPSK